MLKLVLIAILPFLLFFGDSTDNTASSAKQDAGTGTLKKMVPQSGTVTLDLDLNSVRPETPRSRDGRSVAFALPSDSFLAVLIFNNEVRTPLPGSISLIGASSL